MHTLNNVKKCIQNKKVFLNTFSILLIFNVAGKLSQHACH